MTKTVRKFSAAGPCITLGVLLRETASFYVYAPRHSGYDDTPKQKRVGKDRYGMVHTEACVSCRDHNRTQYPNGYMD
jgi:hypothetical protein